MVVVQQDGSEASGGIKADRAEQSRADGWRGRERWRSGVVGRRRRGFAARGMVAVVAPMRVVSVMEVSDPVRGPSWWRDGLAVRHEVTQPDLLFEADELVEVVAKVKRGSNVAGSAEGTRS